MRGVLVALVLLAPALGRSEPSRDDLLNEARARKAPARPAPVWAGIDPRTGPQPLERKKYFESYNMTGCTAAHDHCLPAWTWFVVSKADDRLVTSARVAFLLRGDDGLEFGLNTTRAFTGGGVEMIGYRTVPATRRHLVPGVRALALDYPLAIPETEATSLDGYWSIGTVKSVDWSTGKLYLVGKPEPYWISSARVAVLRWSIGGKVEVLLKLPAAELDARPEETFAPLKVVVKKQDPWAEVGADGTPRTTIDTVPFEKTGALRCGGENDHCLRPWVWFLDYGGDALPARFKDGKPVKAGFLTSDVALEPGMAYRTVAATAANVKVGSLVIFLPGIAGNESDAHLEKWHMGIVTELQPEAGVFLVKDDADYHKLDLARVAVLSWFPGEKAEALK